MADEPLSGSGDASVRAKRIEGVRAHMFVVSTDAGYESSVVGSDCSGAGRAEFSLRPKVEPAQGKPRANRANYPRPENRDEIRRHWEKAKAKAILMVESSDVGDLVELARAAFALDHLLDDLWSLRGGREKDWAGILNFLQGVFKKAVVEEFTPEQCRAVQAIVTDYLGPATVNRDDVEACLKTLRRAGLDPWRPISADPKEK